MIPDYSFASANWFTLAGQYGYDAANQIADIADAGDVAALNAALSSLRRSGGRVISTAQNGGTSTLGNLWQQLTTDPLAAPADALNSQLGKAFKNFFRSPWIIAAVGLLAFWYFGGFSWLKRKIS